MNMGGILKAATIGSLTVAVIFLPYSITYCHFFILLFIILSLIEGFYSNNLLAPFKSYIFILFLILLLLHLLGVSYSTDQKNAWFAIEKKAFLFALPFSMLVVSPFSKKDMVRLFQLFIFSCLIATFICLYSAFQNIYGSHESLSLGSITQSDFYSTTFSNNWKFLTYGNLASGININPTYFSLYLVFCLLLIQHLSIESFPNYSITKKIALFSVWLYLNLFIILLSSRIMIIALLGVNIMVCYSYLSGSILKRSLFSAFTTVILIGFIYLNPISRYRSEEILTTSKTFSLEEVQTQSVAIRASLWWQGIKSFQHTNPIWGGGTGDVDLIMKEVGEQNHVSNVINSANPHNQYLYTLVGLGSIGVLTLLSCLTVPFIYALNQKAYLYIGFSALFSLLCFTESALEFQKGIAFFAIFNFILIFHYCDLKISFSKSSRND